MILAYTEAILPRSEDASRREIGIMNRTTAVAVALFLAFSGRAWGQNVPAHREVEASLATSELVPGTLARVIVSSPQLSGQISGEVIAATDGNVTIMDSSTRLVHVMSASAIQKVEIGIERRKTRKGLIIGVLAGALSGLIVTTDTGNSESVCGKTQDGVWFGRPCSGNEKAGITVALAGFYGGVGAWLGHRRKSIAWSEPIGRRLSFRLEPAIDGGRAALAFSF
jgi:RNase P/RNase MRP subunit p29